MIIAKEAGEHGNHKGGPNNQRRPRLTPHPDRNVSSGSHPPKIIGRINARGNSAAARLAPTKMITAETKKTMMSTNGPRPGRIAYPPRAYPAVDCRVQTITRD